jgi:hypothetical protein
MIRALRSNGTLNVFFKKTTVMDTLVTTIMIISGLRFNRKSLNDNIEAYAIMILGGSPIKVEVPPILEARA